MATQGQGNWPFVSGWAFRRISAPGTDLPRKIVQQPDNACGQAVFWDWFFDAAGGGPTYYGILKRWTGGAWVKEPLKRWTGAAWVAATLKRWDGSEWKLVDTTGV